MRRHTFCLTQRRQGAKENIRMQCSAAKAIWTRSNLAASLRLAPLREIFLFLFGGVNALAGMQLHVGAEQCPVGPPVRDPAKIVGVRPVHEVSPGRSPAMDATPHYATFETLHRKPRAKEIADKLGLQSIKRSDVCTQCHYTKQNEDGRERVVAGVSCESCHGASGRLGRRSQRLRRTGRDEGVGVGRASGEASGRQRRARA